MSEKTKRRNCRTGRKNSAQSCDGHASLVVLGRSEVSATIMGASFVQRLGEELLQEPVQRVNNVSNFLKVLSNDIDEVLVGGR